MHLHAFRRWMFSMALFPLAGAPALAQDFPARTITIVVAYSAGGTTDASARLLAEKLHASLGQPVVVDNKTGAAGMLGANYVAKAAPDGYTLLMATAGEAAINPLIYKQMQYQPERDLSPIAFVCHVPNVMAANPKLPVHDVAELVDYAKKNPASLSYATSGVGNMQHLNGELLQTLTGIQMQHIPYKGAANQVVDVVAGTVPLTFLSMGTAAPYIKSGKLRALAMTSAKRAGFAPDIPAIAEYKGAASYDLENWYGVFAPAGTPAAVQAKLNTAFNEAMRDPEVIRKLREFGGEPEIMSQQQYRDFLQKATKTYASVVQAAHIQAE